VKKRIRTRTNWPSLIDLIQCTHKEIKDKIQEGDFVVCTRPKVVDGQLLNDDYGTITRNGISYNGQVYQNAAPFCAALGKNKSGHWSNIWVCKKSDPSINETLEAIKREYRLLNPE